MTDRELLELAAKAAGNEVWTDIDGNLYTATNDLIEKPWNPLTDDGDALRLAVCLNIRIGFRPSCYADTPSGIRLFGREFCSDGDDKNARTRHAIVRAAAEIGRNMK